MDDSFVGAREISAISIQQGSVFNTRLPGDLVDIYTFEAATSGSYRIKLSYFGPSYVDLLLYQDKGEDDEDEDEGESPQLLEESRPKRKDRPEIVSLSVRKKLKAGKKYYIVVPVAGDSDEVPTWRWNYTLILTPR